MPYVLMNSDEGNRSAGRTYLVSDREARRLTGMRVKARTVRKMGLGEKAVEDMVQLASLVSKPVRKVVKPAKPAKLVRLMMLTDVPKHSAGKIYSLPEGQATKFCDGYTSGDQVFRPVAVPVDDDDEPLAALPEKVEELVIHSKVKRGAAKPKAKAKTAKKG